jgi:hypothetical protein
METELAEVVKILLSLSVFLSAAVQTELGYSLERYAESLHVYYESNGVVNLYNVEWKATVYVNLEFLAVRRYLHHIRGCSVPHQIRYKLGRLH